MKVLYLSSSIYILYAFFFFCLFVYQMAKFMVYPDLPWQASHILRDHSGDLVSKESGLGRRVYWFCILLSAYKPAWNLNDLSNCLARDHPMGRGSHPDVAIKRMWVRKAAKRYGDNSQPYLHLSLMLKVLKMLLPGHYLRKTKAESLVVGPRD